MDVYACATSATEQVVAQLLEEFAPVRKVIKVDPSKALRTASDFFDNKWTYTDNFKADDEKLFIVVNLPVCCDRNRFRLTIVRKDQREDLLSQDIVWTRQHSASGYRYLLSPKEVAAKGGLGQYEVKFYSGPEPVLRRTFTIR